MSPLNRLLSKFIFIVILFHSIHANPQNFAQNLIDNGLLVFNNQTGPLALAIQAAATIYQPIDSNQVICLTFSEAQDVAECQRTQHKIFTAADTIIEDYIYSIMYLNFLSVAGSVLYEGYDLGVLEIPATCGPSCINSPLSNALFGLNVPSAYDYAFALQSDNYYSNNQPNMLLANGTSFYEAMANTFVFSTTFWSSLTYSMQGYPVQPSTIDSFMASLMTGISFPSVPSLGFFASTYASSTGNLTAQAEWYTSVLIDLYTGNFTMPPLHRELLPSLANLLPFIQFLFDPQQAHITRHSLADAFSSQLAYFSNFTTDWCPAYNGSVANNISPITNGLLTYNQLSELCLVIDAYVPTLLDIQQDFIDQIVNDNVSPFNLTVSNSTLKAKADTFFSSMSSILTEISTNSEARSPESAYSSFDKPGTFIHFLYMLATWDNYTSAMLDSFKYDLSGLHSTMITNDYSMAFAIANSSEYVTSYALPTYGLGSEQLLAKYQDILHGPPVSKPVSKPAQVNTTSPASNQTTTNQPSTYQNQNNIPSLNQIYKQTTGISIGGIVAIAVVLFFVSIAITICFWCWCCKTTAKIVSRSITDDGPVAPPQNYVAVAPAPAKQPANEQYFV